MGAPGVYDGAPNSITQGMVFLGIVSHGACVDATACAKSIGGAVRLHDKTGTPWELKRAKQCMFQVV
jgi:hypothetical protein